MRSPTPFVADQRGAAAAEFITISSFVLMLLLAGFDFGRYVVAAQRVEAVSYNIAQMLSQTGPNGAAVDSGDGIVSDPNLTFYQNSGMITFPEVLTDSYNQQLPWTSILSINMTSLKFVPNSTSCGSSCTYTPKVIWTTGNRPCGSTFTQVPDTNPPTPSTLPSDLYGPGGQIVVDVTYNFVPTIGAQWLKTMKLTRTTYMTPRNVTLVELTANSAIARNCSGAL